MHIRWNREAGFGAIFWDGSTIQNKYLANSLSLTKEQIDRIVALEKAIIQNRSRKLHGSIPFPNLGGKLVIIVYDGVASIFSMLTTVKTLKNKAGEVVVAVPTASLNAIQLIKAYIKRIVCLNIRSVLFFQ